MIHVSADFQCGYGLDYDEHRVLRPLMATSGLSLR
jgi:hypothetical protein